MIAITTSNSMSVKAERLRTGLAPPAGIGRDWFGEEPDWAWGGGCTRSAKKDRPARGLVRGPERELIPMGRSSGFRLVAVEFAFPRSPAVAS
jgi:hypothetical protein